MAKYNDPQKQNSNRSELPRAAGSTVGEAYAGALDPKYMRTKTVQRDPECMVCHHGAPPEWGHALDCPLASMADAKIALAKARKNEEWARKRAAFWLLQVRQMHGKLAMLKAELRKVRRLRQNAEMSHSPTNH